jgi:phosphoribosylaminoimidazolecarboxamide formyltransferase/IMP cyclohydrolase
MSENVKIRRALLSVYDKTDLALFAGKLVEMGVELISSGGTAKAIAEAGIKVRQVQEWTGFPSMLGHRVATLHPKVHGGILAVRDNPEHQADIEKYGLELVDLVVVGLYPFEQVIAKPGCTLEQAVEMIDIGGPALVRAAAKNYRFVSVVTNKLQHQGLLAEMAANDGCMSLSVRKKLAFAAFCTTARYDEAIKECLTWQPGFKHDLQPQP